MNLKIWKILIPLPIAAFMAGHRVQTPKQKEMIPIRVAEENCDYNTARKLYLRAYSYSNEDSIVAYKLLTSAESSVSSCSQADQTLRKRILEAKKTWFL